MSERTVRRRMLDAYHGIAGSAPAAAIYERYLPRGEMERVLREKGLGIIAYHPVWTFPGPAWHQLPGYASEIKNTEFRVERRTTGGRVVERQVYTTPVGTVYKDITASRSAQGETVLQYFIKSKEDYKTLAYLVENSVLKSNPAILCRKKAELGGDGILLGRLDRSPYQKLLIEWVGPERLFFDLADSPDVVESLMGILGERAEECRKGLNSTEADVLWQPDNITSDMTPPGFFEKYCLPYYQKFVRWANTPYAVHMDGKMKALEALIRKAGIGVIESMSLPGIGGDYSLSQTYEAFPGVTVLPNFPSNLAGRGEREIRDFAGRLCEEAAGRPFMLQISEDLPEDAWRTVLPAVLEGIGELEG